jgi:hypothetical protein
VPRIRYAASAVMMLRFGYRAAYCGKALLTLIMCNQALGRAGRETDVRERIWSISGIRQA